MMVIKRTATLTVALVSLAAFGVLGLDLYRRAGAIREEALEGGRGRAVEIASAIDRRALDVMAVARRLAGLDPCAMTPVEIERTIRESSERDGAIRGITIAFERDAYPHRPGLFAPYYNEPEGRIIPCHEVYSDASGKPYDDRSDRYHDWFWEPIDEGVASWDSVNYGLAAKAEVVNYSVPFRASGDAGDGPFVGVVAATLSVQEGLNRLLKDELPRGASYGFLVDRQGRFLAHPSIEYVREERLIGEMVEEVADPSFEAAVGAMLRGGTGRAAFRNDATGRASVLFYRPIPSGSGWSLGLVFPEAELYSKEGELYRTQLTLALTSILFSATAIALATGIYRCREVDWWWLSILFSAACLAGIASTCWLAMNRPIELASEEGAIIGDRAGLDRFLDSLIDLPAVGPPGRRPEIVGTGIWLSGLEFETAHNVKARGLVWQHLPRDGPDAGADVPDQPPFAFPDAAPDAEAVAIEPAYRGDRDGEAIVGWSFAATLRPELSFGTYPFDRQVLRIRLRPRALDEEVILAPDLRSYERLDPGSMPGLRRRDLLPGWRIEGTYFEYRPLEAGTGFGLGRPDRLVELCYCVVLRRGILSPIITHLVPIGFVLLLLYGVLVSSTKIEGRCSIAGFNTFGVLEIAAALLFVICLAQIDLRNSLMVEEITYLEYFYFITYAIILLVAVDSIIFTTTDSVAWIEYRDNLAAKLLYWPVFFALSLAATIYAFT